MRNRVIPRNPHPTSNRVIAAITLMFRIIPKEDTLNRLNSDFGALMRWKNDVTDTSKATKMAIGRRGAKETHRKCSPGEQ
jgi:hypothetical protein